MLSVWVYSLASVFVVSLISLIGVFTLSINRELLYKTVFFLVALAVGALLGDVLIHIFPKIWGDGKESLATPIYIFAGFLLFFVIEKFLRWHHSHGLDEEKIHEHSNIKHIGYLNLISDGIHNAIDGVLIGASYLISIEIGIATTTAVLLHEIPQEIGDFGLLIYVGFTRGRALFFNLLSALCAVLGVLVALFFGQTAEGFAFAVLPITAGGFLYIAAADLVPELKKVNDPVKSMIQFFGVLIGFALMYLLVFFE